MDQHLDVSSVPEMMHDEFKLLFIQNIFPILIG